MRTTLLIGLLALLFATASEAKVINVEFKFTPFTGDPATDEMVTTVPGTARVLLNGVPYAEQEVGESEVPVLFDAREIAPSVWLPAESCGPALRKGKNSIRIEFTPLDPKASYRAQLRWAEVLDESSEESGEGTYSATNQSGEGMEEKEATGAVVFEREFAADFASDLPWHHYAAVTALTDADRTALAALVAGRVDAFEPDFAKLYAIVEKGGQLDLAALRESKCLDRAYAAGARIAVPPAEEIEFVASGNPEVVIQSKQGRLYFPADISVFDKIEDEEDQMCIGAALAAVYPPRLVVVRNPAGGWEVVY